MDSGYLECWIEDHVVCLSQSMQSSQRMCHKSYGHQKKQGIVADELQAVHEYCCRLERLVGEQGG